jgi:hypothetical protein
MLGAVPQSGRASVLSAVQYVGARPAVRALVIDAMIGCRAPKAGPATALSSGELLNRCPERKPRQKRIRKGDDDEKRLVAVLLTCCLAACAQSPAPQQQGAAPPEPAASPLEAAPPAAPRVTSEAQIAPGRWDVDRVRCSDLLSASDDDRAAAVMFYYGYLAAKAGIRVIDVNQIDGNVRKVMDQCATAPNTTVPQAFREALARGQ